jgi:hypothetical protein
MIRAAAVLLLLPLGACATTQRPSEPAELVWISVSGDEACSVEVEGRHFPLPSSQRSLDAHLKRLARSSQGAVLGGADDQPALRCWVAAMFVAQRAGFVRLGFVSPPEGAETQ